jgi:hypothetical protein
MCSRRDRRFFTPDNDDEISERRCHTFVWVFTQITAKAPVSLRTGGRPGCGWLMAAALLAPGRLTFTAFRQRGSDGIVREAP